MSDKKIEIEIYIEGEKRRWLTTFDDPATQNPLTGKIGSGSSVFLKQLEEDYDIHYEGVDDGKYFKVLSIEGDEIRAKLTDDILEVL